MLRAALFDVGDTLVEHWAPRDRLDALLREALRREFGQQDWHKQFIGGSIGPSASTVWQPSSAEHLTREEERQHDDALKQETLRWYAEWFRNAQIGIDDVDLERLRVAMTVPLDLVSTPVPGAFTAVRWCKAKGLRVVLVTNTLSRGDEEVWKDWRRFGLADAIDGVVSSHSVGWQKPHRAIYDRALQIAGALPKEAFMVGDRLDARHPRREAPWSTCGLATHRASAACRGRAGRDDHGSHRAARRRRAVARRALRTVFLVRPGWRC